MTLGRSELDTTIGTPEADALRANDAVFSSPDDGPRPVVHRQLLVEVGEVRFDGTLSDVQPSGDRLVGETAHEQGEDLEFPVAERRSARGNRCSVATKEKACGARIEGPVTTGGRSDATDQLVGFGVLEQVADGASVERVQFRRQR